MKKLLLSALFSALLTGQAVANEKFAVKVEELAKSTSSWEDTPLPAYGKGEPEITILKITIPPGIQLPLHMHPVINAGVLTKGQLTVFTKGKKKKLEMKAGDSIVEIVNKWHYGRNEGDVPAEIIVFYAGTKDKAVTVAAPVTLPANSPVAAN